MSKPFWYMNSEGDGENYCQDCGQALLRANYPAHMSKYDEEDYANGIAFSERGREFTDRPLQCAAGAECCNRVKVKGQWVGAMLDCPLSQDGRKWLASKEAKENESYALWLTHYGIEIGLKLFTGNKS